MPDEKEVAWLHLLKRDTWMTVGEVFIAAQETSMVNLALITAGLNFDTITGIMRGFCARGQVEEKEVPMDKGNQPAWKLVGEQPDLPPEVAFLPKNLTQPPTGSPA